MTEDVVKDLEFARLFVARTYYPKEYEIAIRTNYPKRYVLIGCKWLHDWRGWDGSRMSVNGLQHRLLQWEKYVGDKEPIENIKNLDDLAHTIYEYQTLGHRDLKRKKSFLYDVIYGDK